MLNRPGAVRLESEDVRLSYEAKRLREEAASCRRLAAEMQSSIQRSHYLTWAEEYERLAEASERKAAVPMTRRIFQFST